MKTKHIIISILFVALSTSMHANNSFSEKDEKLAEKELQFEFIGQLLENKSFVLEADWLSDRYGNRVYVSPIINFVKVDSTDGVLQIGFNSRLGYNGVGGVTADGRVTEIKIRENEKKLTYYVSMTFMTSIGTYHVNMHVGSDGRARATISGLNRGKLTYEGDLVALNQAEIFTGQTTY